MDIGWKELLEPITYAALSALSGVLTILIGMVSMHLRHWLASKAHFASFECATTKLEKLSTTAVADIEQTLVRTLKAEGRWTPETALAARDAALAVMMQHLGPKGLAELQECLGLAYEDVKDMALSYIEKQVLGSLTKPPAELSE